MFLRIVFQQTNPAELLKLYLTFDLLEEAAHLALDYIDAVLGPQKEEFALQVFHRLCSHYTCVSLYISPCTVFPDINAAAFIKGIRSPYKD